MTEDPRDDAARAGIPDVTSEEPEPDVASIETPVTSDAAAEEEQVRLIEAANETDVERELRRLTRRGFITAGLAAAAGVAAYKWVRTRPREGGVEWPLRRVLERNEGLAQEVYSSGRLSPAYPPARVRPLRVNGGIGLEERYDLATWQLQIEGAASGRTVTLGMDDIRSFPRREMITEFRCIEGWSVIVKWAGVRLSDLMAAVPPPARGGGRGDLTRPERLVRYLAMETPGRGYYVGLDMPSALHPQTLLAYELNGEPLTRQHGAPLRLAIPIKYGVKNIKRVAVIRYTDVRPADFWAERGYDWYVGL